MKAILDAVPARLALPVALLSLLLATSAPTAAQSNAALLAERLDEVLKDMGLARGDLFIRHDWATPDTFRLPLVDSLMCDPASLLTRVDAVASRAESATSTADVVAALWNALSVPIDTSYGRGGQGGAADREEPPARMRDVVGRFAHLPRRLRLALVEYLGALGQARRARGTALAAAEARVDFLYENAAFAVTPRPGYEQADPFEVHRLEKQEEALTNSILKASESIDLPGLAKMSAIAAEAADILANRCADIRATPASSARYRGREATFAGAQAEVAGEIVYLGVTEYGPVVVGGPDDNTYTGTFALIVDWAGADTYRLASNRNVCFSLVIDCDGNDSYVSEDRVGVAGAIFGTSIVSDWAGDDTYRSGHVALGAAIYGAAVVCDHEGNDSYISGGFSQGAGFLGVGVLWDLAGHDDYVAEMQSQGFGYVRGAGLMLERGGNDTYSTKMSQTDILRYDDHFLTLSQGCAFGSRPDYSGGVGLIVESGGNDLYSSDIFGQGVGYWFAVGAIVDRGGHDRYVSYQYAQGSGVHLAFGLLADESGDDFYESKGVSQGCGHDLSLGLLADFSGNDCYTATDLSQGAGNANGTGVLFDADGVDSYSSKSTINVSGYGDYRREFGSIGVSIDAAGKDFYSARGANEAVWESGKYGMGADMPGEAAKPRGDLLVAEYPFEPRDFSVEELYILAMRSEPRFARWKTHAFDRMVAEPAASVEYLKTVLDTKNATERHAIKDILVKIGSPAVPMLSEATLAGNDLARGEASWILGLVGDRAGFDALMELSRSDNWRLRSGAINSLARLRDMTDGERVALKARLAEVLGGDEVIAYVKKDALFAIGAQTFTDLADLAVDALDDPHYSVRYSAAETLRQLAGPAGERVARALTARLPYLSILGLGAAIYAAAGLPVDARLDMLDAALALPPCVQEALAVPLSRLAAQIKPETAQQEARLAAVTLRIPASWRTRAMLGEQ